jgi:hypothetical protein
VCIFRTGIQSGTFMYISKSNDPYKYVLLKSMSGLCMNPCATSLTLYLTTSLFLFLFQMNTHFNPTWKIPGGVGITSVNTFIFLSELSLASIASFHLFQFKNLLHSAMVLGSGLARKFSAMMVEKHGLTIVVLDHTLLWN